MIELREGIYTPLVGCSYLRNSIAVFKMNFVKVLDPALLDQAGKGTQDGKGYSIGHPWNLRICL